MKLTGLLQFLAGTLLLLQLVFIVRAEPTAPSPQERADAFLRFMNAGYQALYRVENEAQWLAATDVTPVHDAASATAGKARAAFNGSPIFIREAQALLKNRAQLNPITVRQLERVLLNAAEGPMTNPELVAARIEAETQQASTLNGFTFQLDGRPISANEIDNRLRQSNDLEERRAVWEASKQSGPALKPGLIKLQKLRNGVARELGHPDYFALQVASYGMTTEEMLKLQQDFMRELRPLYLQLHTWAKHELARKYNQPVPKLIPAHWINNRWSQEWPGLVQVANLDDRFKGKSAEWIVQTAEKFYVALGFPKLPHEFWSRSDLYPVRPGETRKKNTHASCWHVDLENDVRSLMSVEPNAWWFITAHHELGHGYYFLAYTRPDVPPLLRLGANPAFHEAMGELVALAVRQPPYLQSLGILPPDFEPDEVAFLLDEALTSSVCFIFWSSGTMTHWEADLYAHNLDPNQWNARWWDYVRMFQGVEPPTPRSEQFCDAATKTHINDNPAYYYSYAIATVLKFQLHEYIARKILKEPIHRCNYANHPAVGDFLHAIMEKGATQDWRKVLHDATGEDLSTRAMMDYFKPLLAWLQQQNKGRTIGWD
jgi:peptidyl-dipeptidase A